MSRVALHLPLRLLLLASLLVQYSLGEYLRSDSFDWSIANTSVWLSSGAYCPPATYLNRKYEGYSEGFVPSRLIFDEKSDIRGYIGHMPTQKAIYVVFRGSTSVYNWLEDLDAFQIPYADCEDCEVHEGFFYGKESVIDDIIATVKSLTTIHPDYSIVVTGHSLGAALASLTALDLVKTAGIDSRVKLVNFGSPRFGNLQLASWASKKIQDRFRVTHMRDPVPHVPFHDDFTHISGEWYEDDSGSLHRCVEFEDPQCAYQWYLTFFTIDDHMNYLDLGMGCDFVSDGGAMTEEGQSGAR